MEDLRKSVYSLNLKVGFEETGSESVLPRPFAQSPTCFDKFFGSYHFASTDQKGNGAMLIYSMGRQIT